MKTYIIAASLLISCSTFFVAKAEADIVPNIPPEAVGAFFDRIQTGIWESQEDLSLETHASMAILMNSEELGTDTVKGLKNTLSPVIIITSDTELPIPLKAFPAPWMSSLDPDGEFARRLREGIFIIILDRDSQPAHKFLSIINNHEDTPNPYLALTQQTGLGSLDKAFSVVSYRSQLPAMDPDGNFPRLAKLLTPKVMAVAAPQEEVTFMGRIMAWFKSFNTTASSMTREDITDGLFGTRD